jgi:hypothetical protein
MHARWVHDHTHGPTARPEPWPMLRDHIRRCPQIVRISDTVRDPARHRTTSRRSAAKSRWMQVVRHPNSGPYHARPYRGPYLLRLDRRGRDQLHQRHRRLAHLLHRHAPAVVQVLVRATLRDLGPRASCHGFTTASGTPAAWRGRENGAGCHARSPGDRSRPAAAPLATVVQLVEQPDRMPDRLGHVVRRQRSHPRISFRNTPM